MNPYQISFTLIFLCFLFRFNVCTSDPNNFTANVSINCGSTGTSSAHSGRKWLGDVQPKCCPLLHLKGLSTTSTAIRELTSADPVPYMTARVSTSRFSYAFQVKPGQKIIRLHFNPSGYKGFKRLKDLFTVEAGSFTFLSNFSASLIADALHVSSLIKEFCINIQENKLLEITFSAETSQSPNAFTFINAIEIISVLDSLSYTQGGDNGLQVVGQNSLVHVDNTVALEMIYRLNIKQDFISSSDDSDDIFGKWVMTPRNVVNNSNNVTRKISVDVGFRYLVRLHFSKPELKMAETEGLNFKVFINEMIADTNTNIVIKERHGSRNPCFGDYVELSEISEARRSEQVNKPSARAERLCRRFSLSGIQSATRNFSDGLIIGRGGFGKVYKGLIDKEQIPVAIKRLKSNSNQGAREFLTEIETLSELRHINVLSLIGYCNKGREMILVYEYMASGTLADHLYGLARRGIVASSLTWKQRLDICIGAARGLDYLHTGNRVIHRDVKASNILLDDNLVTKISDFGLAKPEDRSKFLSHVITKVKGTYGYLVPYYYTTKELSRKSDTYAFGVVLLEVLCGRAAVDSGVSEEEYFLSIWARNKIREGEVDQIVASSLRDEISANSQKTFVGIIEKCLHDEPKIRPTMSLVVLQLEIALEQQDSYQNLGWNQIASVSDEIQPSNGTCIPNTVQPTVDTLSMHNDTLPPNAQTKNKVVMSGKKHREKSSTNKASRPFLWDAIWNRVKPSKQYELLLSEEESMTGEVNLPKFDWDQISAATNQFFSSNIVGRGRFGCFYKAVLPSGEVVSVKRCSSYSSEGLEELKNEINLLPILRHRNIIKLLGYGMDGEELLLVYEFMENTSLYYFIGQEQHLQWAVRFQMIMGIAQGLAYLQHDSGLRVIHRDLNISSILLVINMNPKISDFDLARSMVEFQTELELGMPGIKATHGYMPPEYYMHGKISVKTDVYSFGIILLEIVSGGKMSPLYLSRSRVDHMFSLAVNGNVDDQAWMLWNERRAIDLVYDSLGSALLEDEVIRCIDVARLCIQEHPDQRPMMTSVIKMLEGNEEIMQPHLWPPREVSSGISENANVAGTSENTNVDGLNSSNAILELDDTLER
ncbi:hypothetical protein ACS0TY_028493 [Phlomoides rotata]